MEMCVDNPRSGFADLFATHPSIASRIDALVKFAGGHVSELPKPSARAIEQGAGQTARRAPISTARGPQGTGRAGSSPRR